MSSRLSYRHELALEGFLIFGFDSQHDSDMHGLSIHRITPRVRYDRLLQDFVRKDCARSTRMKTAIWSVGSTRAHSVAVGARNLPDQLRPGHIYRTIDSGGLRPRVIS